MYHPRQIGHGNTDGQHKEEVRVGFMLQPVYLFRHKPLQVVRNFRRRTKITQDTIPSSAWARRSA